MSEYEHHDIMEAGRRVEGGWKALNEGRGRRRRMWSKQAHRTRENSTRLGCLAVGERKMRIGGLRAHKRCHYHTPESQEDV